MYYLSDLAAPRRGAVAWGRLLLTAQLASGNPLFIVCHGPAAMLATRIHGVSPFNGYRVTGFTNKEEEAVGVAPKATWLLETDLKEKIGVDFSSGEIWKPYMVEDRNLVTGQNPASAAVLAKRLLEVLGERASRAGPRGRASRSVAARRRASAAGLRRETHVSSVQPIAPAGHASRSDPRPREVWPPRSALPRAHRAPTRNWSRP